MTRVLLHAGFHKTGTTSLQDFLRANRPLIAPHAAIVLPARTREIARWVWRYHQTPDPRILTVIAEDLAALLAGFDLSGRDLVLSDENLLGPMPQGATDQPYPHAAAILATLAGVLADRAGPVTLYLSHRDQGAWAESLYAHLARKPQAVRMTEDRASFTARLATRRQTGQIAAIRGALPRLPVIDAEIGTLTGPLGIAQPVVDFLRLPPQIRARLTPPPRRNAAPDPALVDRLVALNRSDLDDEALAAAKRALLAGQESP